MSQGINKQFKNNATTPIIVSVSALADGLPFAPVQLDDRITQIVATGGTLTFSDDAKAERMRMHNWINHHFIGKTAAEFHAHSGTVPSVEELDEQRAAEKRVDLPQPEVRIVNVIDMTPGVSSPEFAKRIAEHILKKNPELNPRPYPFSAKPAVTPALGSYWQDKERPVRFFRVIALNQCAAGHMHVRMLRVDSGRGGEYDWQFTTNAEWDKMFRSVKAGDVPGNPYADLAADLYGVSFKPARDRKVGMPPELGMPYGDAVRVPFNELEVRWHALSTEDAEKLVEQYRTAHPDIADFFREFIGGVPFDGKELPPAPGERYYSYISGKTYTVIAHAPKFQSPYIDILMEREGDGHRTKFTFQDHATWLTVWRPLDDEDKPRKVVEVEVKLDTKGAAEALRNVGDASAAAAEAGRRFHEAFEAIDDAAVFDLVRVFDELHRRLPGWDEKPTSGPVLNQTDLAIRAIRTLVRQRNNASDDLQATKRELGKAHEHAGEQLRVLNHRNKKIAELEEKQRSGYWDAERVRREQDSTRELVRLYTKLFARHHGMQCAKDQLISLNATSLAALPPEAYMQFVTKCEDYSHRASSNEG